MRRFISLLLCTLTLSAFANPVIYQGSTGIGKGKHLVFIASDHEYRSEETLPALARVLAKHHGFKCTVLFGLNDAGEITAGASNIPGMEALKSADGLVIFTRFLDLPDDQMQHLQNYLDRAGPVFGLRTSSHAFKIAKDAKWARYAYNYSGPEWTKGFGHQILGNTWVGHYGRNHKQGTRITLKDDQKDHPILRGVGKTAFCHAGAYNGVAADDFTVLTTSQPLVSMDPKSKVDAAKPPVPSTWTRHYPGKNGKKGRVFHSTQGASEDILDDNYRRLLINGVLWTVGLENAITPDLNIAFVGPYNPVTFKNGGHAKHVKPADLQGWDSPILPVKKGAAEPAAKKPATKKPAKRSDAKNKQSGKKDPAKDPTLEKYYINLRTSPRAGAATPVPATLPLSLEPKTRIALIGGLLLDEERRKGHLETLLHQRFPKHNLAIRNLSWPADEVDLQPRPSNFGDLDQHLTYFKPDVIFASFGANESFAGADGLPAFRKRLDTFLARITARAYNGKTAARVVLFAPTAAENLPNNPAADRNNANLALYTKALAEGAKKHGAAFVDTFTPSSKGSEGRLTKDGWALSQLGHKAFAVNAYQSLFNETPAAINEDLRALVVEKATQFFYRYRPLNTYYYTGARNRSYGYLDFLPAMRNFDIMVANRDKAIHQTAATGKVATVDDSNVPELDQVAEARGANRFMSPADERKAFTVDPRFDVSAFATEEDFPELACPIQMRWDARGRLWVSTSVTYPHVYPGQEPRDKIIILEDTDNDGKADTCKTWADDLHIPLSFALDDQGGVYVSEEPHLTYLRDTDGDDKADTREILYTGFGCEDSHHALHDFMWTPGGKLLFRESIFHNTQVETAWGPVRAHNSSWFLYDPSNRKLSSFGAYPNTNPWGITFDHWGNHVASHPVFGNTFHATNPPFPKQHPKASGMQAYSGVCGQDFVTHDFWPKDMQGGFIKNRYKPTNRVEFHRWIDKGDHFAEEHVGNIIFSSNLSFIPVDFKFGPRGAAYVCDWYNPVKGHAQYSLRDPRRDRKAGRIWRIVPKGAKLATAPKIEGVSIAELIAHLESPHMRTRHWARRALRARDHGEVKKALDARLAKTDVTNAHLRLELLWVYEGINAVNEPLLSSLVGGKEDLAAASALRTVRHWHTELGAEKTSELLRAGASHDSAHVRREAAIAASWVGTSAALEAILPIIGGRTGTHLSYALSTSLNSEALARHWVDGPARGTVTNYLANIKKHAGLKEPSPSASEKQFDLQKDLQVVEIGCIPERLLFTRNKFQVKAGAPVKLIFSNPDATQHNLVLLDKGTPVAEIGVAGNDMAKTPEGEKKHFVPDDKRILQHSKLLNPYSVEVLRFTAPTKPGVYPYVCTFPGHWVLMQGVMVVK